MKLALLFLSAVLYSSVGVSEERSGKAVYEVSAENGMKLSEPALKNIELTTLKISDSTQIEIKLESLVYFQDQVGVYRLRDGWFKLVKIQIMSKGNEQASIKSSELKPGDSIVVKGAALLRVSEMDAFGSEE